MTWKQTFQYSILKSRNLYWSVLKYWQNNSKISDSMSPQIHLWDYGTPIEETLSALNDLVKSGMVRYIGMSNLKGWQLQKAVEISRQKGYERITGLQVLIYCKICFAYNFLAVILSKWCFSSFCYLLFVFFFVSELRPLASYRQLSSYFIAFTFISTHRLLVWTPSAIPICCHFFGKFMIGCFYPVTGFTTKCLECHIRVCLLRCKIS